MRRTERYVGKADCLVLSFRASGPNGQGDHVATVYEDFVLAQGPRRAANFLSSPDDAEGAVIGMGPDELLGITRGEAGRAKYAKERHRGHVPPPKDIWQFVGSGHLEPEDWGEVDPLDHTTYHARLLLCDLGPGGAPTRVSAESPKYIMVMDGEQ